MKDTVHEEITKIKNDPQYIDFFKEKISQQWGDEKNSKLLQGVINYFKNEDQIDIYGRINLIRQQQYIIHGELDEAIDKGKQLIEVYQKHGRVEWLLENYNRLFLAYMYKGDCKNAVHYASEALKLMTNEDYHSIHIRILLNSAKLYILMREFKRAEEILENVSHMSFFFNDEDKLVLAINWVSINLQKGEIDKAMEQCQLAYELAEKLESATGEGDEICLVLSLRGYIYMARGLTSQAERDFNEARKMAGARDYKIAYITCLIGNAVYELQQEKYEAAAEMLQQAEKIASTMGSVYFVSIIQRRLYTCYEKLHQWEKAVKACEKGQEFFSRIYDDKSCLWIKQLDSKNMVMQLERYKKLYCQMEQVAKIGASFTAQLSPDHIQKIIYDEISKLLELDFLGIAYLKDGNIEYKVFDVKNEYLEENNDLVRYTHRMVEYCIEFQKDILINDGNFEEYSIKTIKESNSQAKLQSVMVNVLKADESVVGALILGSYKANSYSENDLNSAKIIASYLAISLKNSDLYQRVCYLAQHDALTGLLTRGIALKNGEALFRGNHKKGKSTAIIMFDTDNFKQVNDKYGHQLGDSVLKKIGEILMGSVRKCDYVGRYGGEEFIAILDSVSYKDVVKIAERVKEQLEGCRFENKKEKDIKVTLSGGVYVCNEYTLNFADAIRFADHALYRAKLLGRNRIISYSLTV